MTDKLPWADEAEPRQLVLSISGGKDSGAAALHLEERGLEFSCVFADTGWEAPQTYEYIEQVLQPRFGPIAVVRCDYKGATDMESLIRVKNVFPWRKGRFCTEELKSRPIQRHLATFENPINVTGIRRDESRARRDAPEWQADTRDWGSVWQPLVEWTTADVVDIHKRKGMPMNPLYCMGASRVGCWPCINAGKNEIATLSSERVELLSELEAFVTEEACLRYIEKNGVPSPWLRTFFQGRGPRDLGGAKNAMPIEDVIAWARTGRGGRQFELFEKNAGDACVLGLCE